MGEITGIEGAIILLKYFELLGEHYVTMYKMLYDVLMEVVQSNTRALDFMMSQNDEIMAQRHNFDKFLIGLQPLIDATTESLKEANARSYPHIPMKPRQAAMEITCPQCNGKVFANTNAKRVICPHCNSLLEAQTESNDFKQKESEKKSE